MQDEKFVRPSDFNIEGKMGKPPLHFVASEGSKVDTTVETINILLEKMDDPFTKDDVGNTVLHHSVLNRDDGVRSVYKRFKYWK